ncbi:MAG: glycerate kinase [Nitrospiraceae bacterium]|nr:MAG: glycerate kinase [Nitrospiraceae bacterium]
MQMREIAGKIFSGVLESVNPLAIVKGYGEQIRSYSSSKDFNSIRVVGFGKASCQMARAVEESLGPDAIASGIVITKYGHAGAMHSAVSHRPEGSELSGLRKIRVFEAGHPIPDQQGVEAAEEIIRLLAHSKDRDLVLCLVSGGGSALFVSPCEGITLREKQAITDLLLKSGADITELNAVRKHLSKVKGGRLAEIAAPAEIISLMISDVIGDRLDVIASGPTAPDPSTFQDALDVIRKYSLADSAPASVMELLERGLRGDIPDTPKAGDPLFSRVQNLIVGSNRIAIERARQEAEALGYRTEVLSSEISGEARDVGQWLARKAREAREAVGGSTQCFISGGETTVHVRGRGKGGRNTELALSFAMEADGMKGVTLLSAGTDGTDGPTDAAGAIVDGGTVERARSRGLNPREYLENNDSYTFFKAIDSLLITGPTGTNVMDVQILIVEQQAG